MMKLKLTTLTLVALLGGLTACSQEPTAQTTKHVAIHQSLQIRHVTALQASEIAKESENLIILDIRTPAEYTSGHIEGALNIDFKAADFATQLHALDLEQEYLIHCRSGARSTASLAIFERLGFTHILHMDGGIKAWKKANLPTIP